MTQQYKQNRFEGFDSPTYTQVPDQLFDHLLPDLSGAELKVLLYVVRRTMGFKRDADSISINQLMHGITRRDGRELDRGTGLSRDSVTRAVKSLLEQGIIVAVRNRSQERGDEPTTYTLRMKDREIGLPESENRTPPSLKIGHAGVRKSDSQETVEQERAIQQTETSFLRQDVNHSNSKERTRKKITETEVETPLPVQSPRRSSSGFTRISELIPSPALPVPETQLTSSSMRQAHIPHEEQSSLPPNRVSRRAQKLQKGAAAIQVEQSDLPDNTDAQILTTAPRTGRIKQPAPPNLSPDELAALTYTIQEISEKLNDSRHCRSNVTQAQRILEASGLNRNAWTVLLWSVYHRTAEQQGRLAKPAAWFFTALREEVEQRTSGQSLVSSLASGAPLPPPSLAGRYAHLVKR